MSLIMVVLLLGSLFMVSLGNERVGTERVAESTVVERSSNFEVEIISPEEGESFQKNETIRLKYEVENTGEIEGAQEVTTSFNGEELDSRNLSLEATEITEEEYEFEYGYWSDQFDITYVRLDSIDAPDTVEIGDEFDSTGKGQYIYLFPEPDEISLLEEHLEDYRFTIRESLENDILVEVPADDVDLIPKQDHNYSVFEATLPTEGLEEGDYNLVLEALEDGRNEYSTICKNLTLFESNSNESSKNERNIGNVEENHNKGEFGTQKERLLDEGSYELTVSTEDDEDNVRINVREEDEEDVIKIYDWHDLDDMRNDLDGNYVLMNDLDENTDGYDELVDSEKGWEPIGEYDEENEEFSSFSGTFDGNGYEIRDLFIDRPDEEHVGLFGTSEGKIENIGVVDARVSGYWYVGCLIGSNSGRIENSYSTGEVEGKRNVGGLVGTNSYGWLYRSYTEGKVEGEEAVGGLIGYQWGDPGPDGFAGTENSYSTSDVVGIEMVGGLIGNGGIAGSTIVSSYSRGQVNGEEKVGGFVGYSGGTVRDSFWDIETSGMDESDGGTGMTTAEMKDVATYTDINTTGLNEPWDFVGNPYDDEGDEDIWDIDEEEDINGGYPFLTWGHEDEEDDDETDRYDLTINIEGNGSTEPEEGTHTYDEGEEVIVEAVPDDGWYFDGWTGDEESSDRELDLTMNEDIILTANFEEAGEDEVVLTIEIEGEGSTDPEAGDHIYEEGEEVTIEAFPEEDWELKEWTGDFESEDEEITVTMDDNMEITAVFEEDDDVPGFTAALLVLASLIAVAVYYKKQQR